MRVVFFGTPDIAVPTLEAVAARHTVTAVVCQPDKPRGRGKQPEAPPAKQWAETHGIEVCQPLKLNDGAFESWLVDQAPDVCVVAAYGRLLKQPLLDIPRYGHINMHPSLLPRWRGPSPIQSAVIAGDEETGVTIIRLSLEMDAGDMLLCERTPIGPEENAAELSARLSAMGGRLTVQALELIDSGRANFTPQHHAEAVFCSMLNKEDGYMDWTRSARELHNLVRGAQPWPFAQCTLREQICKIHEARVLDAPSEAAPGTVTEVTRDAVHVATGEGQLAITRFQAPGKKAMAMGDYLRGQAIAPGEVFGTPVSHAG